ncbi:MAG: PAS domain-containing protein [Proteobacteria bacterium]|nr:PAS domain-containing protein [Pseudomonadota bacterium]
MDLYDYVKISESILNKLPGYILILDTTHKIIWANDKIVKSYGLESVDELNGKGYADLRYGVCERTSIIENYEKLIFTLRKKLACLSYLRYSDGWKLTLCEKSPITDGKNEIIGLISYGTDITNYALVDVSRFVFNSVNEFNHTSSKQFSYLLEDETSNIYLLSERQLECLFFLLRGKSDKNIGKMLNLSPRTVESYIQEIKHKMRCLTRAQIIEKSLNEGLLNTFPISLLQKSTPLFAGTKKKIHF